MTIISHEHGFIFIKTPKTAGTSVEVALSQVCGEGDVVAPIRPPEEGHVPRNFSGPDGEFRSHMPAREIRDLLGAERFAGYRRFCIERHPVDKSISHFAMWRNSENHTHRGNPGLSWGKYVRRRRFPMSANLYVDESGSLLVNDILRYEHLEEDLARVMGELGVAWNGLHVRAKSGFRDRDPGVPTPDEVKPRHRAIIMNRFKMSNAFTGYE